MERIKVESVSYSYQNKYQTVEAVKDVSCTFESGRAVCHYRESRAAARAPFCPCWQGWTARAAGASLVDGEDIGRTDRDAYRREKAAVIYQAFHLFPSAHRSGKCHVSSGNPGDTEKRSEEAGGRLSGGSRSQQEIVRPVSEDDERRRAAEDCRGACNGIRREDRSGG